MAIEIGAISKTYWTTFGGDVVLEPWEAKVSQVQIGISHTATRLMPAAPNLDLKTRFKLTREIMDGTVHVPLFKTREEACAAYPSLKLEEVYRDMELTKKKLSELKEWVKKNGSSKTQTLPSLPGPV